jgi:5-oxoprolinase (ATP-hydrolysing) subunit A
MIKVNCDLGERGPDHPVDIELMKYIQIANIACGGHAGDEKSVACFRKLAEAQKVMITAHLSYPDRENFGRLTIQIPPDALCKSLDDQMQLMPDITAVKFHGALYNDSVIDPVLALVLVQWATAHRIDSIVTPDDSEMAEACRSHNIWVIAEAFAERRYTTNPKSGRLQLVNRKKPYASIHDCETAVAQAHEIVLNHRVEAIIEGETGEPVKKWMNIAAETICIHSDSSIAIELAKGLAK